MTGDISLSLPEGLESVFDRVILVHLWLGIYDFDKLRQVFSHSFDALRPGGRIILNFPISLAHLSVLSMEIPPELLLQYLDKDL